MSSALICDHCKELPATCVGRYDAPDEEPERLACDDCCGHGCEDGHCRPLFDCDDDDGQGPN